MISKLSSNDSTFSFSSSNLLFNSTTDSSTTVWTYSLFAICLLLFPSGVGVVGIPVNCGDDIGAGSFGILLSFLIISIF